MADDRRVKVLVFDFAGQQITAEVGQWMMGQRYSRRSGDIRYATPVETGRRALGGKVLRIIPGEQWQIYLDAATAANDWLNPFRVGEERIRTVIYDADQES